MLTNSCGIPGSFIIVANAILLSADLSELDLPSTATISFPEGKEKIMKFELVLRPDEGMYK